MSATYILGNKYDINTCLHIIYVLFHFIKNSIFTHSCVVFHVQVNDLEVIEKASPFLVTMQFT